MQTSMVSPWRTIIISPKAEEVLDSKMIFNLNEPTKYKDTSYIKPTKYMGVWWEMIIGKSQWAYSTAVSYTHLDVYKRQTIQCSFQKLRILKLRSHLELLLPTA